MLKAPLSDKALLTTGADYWSTHEVPGLGLPSIRVSDGPHGLRGLRVQDDDNPITSDWVAAFRPRAFRRP